MLGENIFLMRLDIDSLTFWLTSSAANWNTTFQVQGLIYTQNLLCAFLQSMHTVGLIQFTGFYVPLVHCGIMQTDLLHVKSYSFEGFWDLVFWEPYAQQVFSPKNTVHFMSQFSHALSTLIRLKLIQDWP